MSYSTKKKIDKSDILDILIAAPPPVNINVNSDHGKMWRGRPPISYISNVVNSSSLRITEMVNIIKDRKR